MTRANSSLQQHSSEETHATPETDTPANFHHQSVTATDCSCPVHADRSTRPFTAPLGLSFATDISISSLTQSEAEAVYRSHHSYMTGDLHPANLAHHGLNYQETLLGAITYRFPLLSRKRLHFDADGNLLPEPLSDADFARLPDTLESRARQLISQIDSDAVATSRVVQGDRIVSADRICLAERMPNLASAGLAASQRRFVNSQQCPDDVEYLITFVRADYHGSMIRALRGKGWRCVGWTRPSQASNRPAKEIRNRYKWVFVCPVSVAYEQCSLAQFDQPE